MGRLPLWLPPQSGFTLVELIIVIVVLSVLSVGSVQFISYSALGYVDTVRRSELAASATLVNEKISRLVRDALPGSVRTNADQSCVELIPVLAATTYIEAPIVGSPASLTQVKAVPIDAALAQTGYLAIYPLGDINRVYDDSQASGFITNQVATIGTADAGASVFTFASFQFLLASPQQRLFITGQPSAFCQDGTRLYFYRDYGFVGNVANLAAALPTRVPQRLLVADQLQAASVVFNFLPSSLRRNGVLSFQMTFISDASSESLQVNQEVQIRNVP
ncbi:MAG: prepilin-type N-terminal cleavage/methylation domain-containing protein [Bermanella sp.]